jgi:hypothetical protein
MTDTYRVVKEDGTFDSYTPAQYIEEFGALPGAVEDVTDTQVDEGLEIESETGSSDEPVVETTEEETITSVDGEVTVPVAQVEQGLKNFEALSPEEQEKVRAEQEAAETATEPVEETATEPVEETATEPVDEVNTQA